MRSAHSRAWLVVSLALAFLPGAFLGNPQIVAYVTLSQSVAPSTGDDNLSFESSRGQADNALTGLSFPEHFAMAYDSQSDRVISVSVSDETWAYDFESNTWTKMTPDEGPADLVWIRQFGGPGFEAAGGVTIDPSGVYVASNAALRKYDADGRLLWTREGRSHDVAVDASAVYVAASSGISLYLIKYDTDGNLLWTRTLGTRGHAHAVAVGPASVYLLGCEYLEDSAPSGCPDDSDVLHPEFSVWKYDPEGNHLWNRTYEFYWATGLAVDLSGVYVGGMLRNGSANLVKYDPEGRLLWTRSPVSGSIWGMAVDGAGVYVAGHTWSTVPGGVNSGGSDAFLLKYDAEGNLLGTRQFGTTGYDVAFGVAVGPSGVYVVGSTEGALAGQTSAGGSDAFLRKYDGAGNVLWTRQFGTSAADEAFRVAVDASGVYVAGDTYGTFPGETSAGEMDAFLARLQELPEGVPGAPLNPRAVPGDKRISLSWQAPSYEGGSPITGYRLYRGTSPGADSFLIELGNVLSYTDMGLTNGATYYYEVSAVNAIGEGPPSYEVPATPVATDSTDPTVIITSPNAGATLTSTSVTVIGTASDNEGVQKVEVSTDGTTWVLATGTTSWSAALTLSEGSNTIHARATDTSGNDATATISTTVIASSTGPRGLDLMLVLWTAAASVGVAAVGVALILIRRRRHMKPGA